MTESQLAFYDWLQEKAPYLQGLWDWNELSLSLESVEHYLSVASHGEAVMCKFAVGVWLGRNERGFDLIKAARVLGVAQRAAIADWLKVPLWP